MFKIKRVTIIMAKHKHETRANASKLPGYLKADFWRFGTDAF
jgi:hypothetical protein